MASVGTVVIEVDADVAKFVAGIKKTNKSINNLERRAKQAQTTIANWAKAVGGIYVVGKAFDTAKDQAMGFLDTASQFEQWENQLSGSYNTVDKLNGVMGLGKEFSDDFNLSVTDVFDSITKMDTYGITPSMKRLEEYTDVAKGSGKSVDQFVEAMADAFMGENERLKEFGVKASVQADKVAYAFVDSSGKSRSVVIKNNKEMIESTLSTIFNDKYSGQAKKWSNSFAGSMQGMKTEWSLFEKELADTGAFKDVGQILEDVFFVVLPIMKDFTEGTIDSIHWVKENSEELKDYAVAIGSVYVAYKTVTKAQQIHTAWVAGAGAVGMLGQISRMNALQRSLVLAKGSQKALNLVMKATPWGLVLGATALVVDSVVNHIREEKRLIEILEMKKTQIERTSSAELKANKEILHSQITKLQLEEKILSLDVSRDGFFESRQHQAQDEFDLSLLRDKIKEMTKMYHLTRNTITIKKEESGKVESSNKSIANGAKEAQDAMAELLKNSGGALDSIKNKHDSATTSAKAHEKAIVDEARAYDDLQNKLESFENTYKQSTMSNFDYKLELLDKEKAEYVAIGAERLKVDEWYNTEFKELLDAKNKLVVDAQKEQDDILQKSWDDANAKQKLLFEKYQETEKEKLDGLKEYYSLMGDYEKLRKLEDAEYLEKHKGIWTDEQFSKAKKKLEELAKTPGFLEGVSDAFNYEKNTNLKDSLDEIGYILGNSLGNIFDDMLSNMKNGMSISNATTSALDSTSDSARDGLKNSGNPYAMALGYGADIIEAVGTELIEIETNIGVDNQAIRSSLEVLNSTMYPHLEHTKKMSEHLENMDRSFGSVVSSIFYGSADINGSSWNDKQSGLADVNGSQWLVGGVAGGVLSELPVIGEYIGGMLDGVANFISSKKVTLKNAGLSFGEQTIDAFIDGVDVRAFELKNTKKKSFGVTYSNKDSMSYSDVDDATSNSLSAVIGEGYASILESSIILGIDDVEERLRNYIVDIGELDFKGMTEEEAQKVLQGVFGEQFSNMSKVAVDGMLDNFKKTGEEYYATLMRVSVGFEQVNYSISRLGFDELDFSSIESNKDLALLSADTSDFMQNFMSDQEQLGIQFNDLDSIFGSVNMEVPKSKDAFYDLVYSLDLTTKEGKEMYSTMMNSAGAFSTYRDGINSIDEAFVSMIQGLRDSQSKYAPVQQYTSDGIYESIAKGTDNSTVEGQISSWYDAQLKLINENSSYQVTIDNSHNKALNDQIKLQNTLADKITETQKSVENDLFKTLIGGNLTQQNYNLDNQLDLGNWDGISSAYSDVLSTGKSNSGTESDYFSLIARANEKIQAVDAPSKQGLLDESIKTTTYTRDTSSAVKALDLKAYNMYDALILENENSIKQVDGMELVAVTFQAGEQKTRDMLDLNFKATNAVMDYSSKMDIQQNSDMKDMITELKNLKKEMEALKKTQEAQNKISYENLKITKIDNAKADADRRIKA